jgi:hypothetical protein
MDARDAFKIGFLLRCAESGVAPAECIPLAGGLLKRAGILGDTGSFLKPLLESGANVGLVAGLGIPLGIGAGGGYLAHKLMEKPIDAEDVKETELADEYQRLARIARTNARLRAMRQRIGQ